MVRRVGAVDFFCALTRAKPKSRGGGPSRLLSRELSWLDFNARLLELAADPETPLLERVKFCSIFSSNLDEFFMVRVAGLMGQAATGLAVRSPDGQTPLAALAEIRGRVRGLSAEQSRLWTYELLPALAENGIRIGDVGACNEEELAELELRFEREIYPVLTPLAVGPGQPFPYISGLSLSLAVFAKDEESGDERFARVKVAEGLPRFVSVGSRGLRVPLEATIAHFLSRLFPQMQLSECAAFRVTRDADFEVSDEADDLLEAVEFELRRRRFGEVVRLEVAESMSDRMLARLRAGLGASAEQEVKIAGLLDLADLSELVAVDRPDLRDEPWVPRSHPRFVAAGAGGGNNFREIRRGDILVHHPYDSFATSFETFVRAAAEDSAITAMKTTVYRTSDESPLVPALIETAEAGKQSVCIVELKARFDERRNIEWSRALERAGVHVVYGFPNLKIHAKMTLLVRREGGELRRYVHLGTGNYHALTARFYEDFGLFTCDEEIAADVADLFNYITGFGRPQRFRKLLVAPFGLRSRLLEEINAVGEAAAAGKTARVRIKVNAFPYQRYGVMTGRAHHRKAVRGLGEGREDRDRGAEHLLAAASDQGSQREHLRPERARPLSGAQSGLHLPGREEDLVLDRQRRPDAPQPGQPARGRRSRGGRGSAAADRANFRPIDRRERERLGARVRRLVGSGAPQEGRAS